MIFSFCALEDALSAAIVTSHRPFAGCPNVAGGAGALLRIYPSVLPTNFGMRSPTRPAPETAPDEASRRGAALPGARQRNPTRREFGDGARRLTDQCRRRLRCR